MALVYASKGIYGAKLIKSVSSLVPKPPIQQVLKSMTIHANVLLIGSGFLNFKNVIPHKFLIAQRIRVQAAYSYLKFNNVNAKLISIGMVRT